VVHAHPLPLAGAKKARAFLECRGGFPKGVCVAFRRLGRTCAPHREAQRGFAAKLDGAEALMREHDLDGEAGLDDVPFTGRAGRAWRRECGLQDAVSELIDAEGWAPHRPVLVVGGVGVRQPGRLWLLCRVRPARNARVGRRYGPVRQAPRALALGALGEAVRARALQAQPAHADQAPRRRHSSTPPPPELHASPLGSPRTSLTRLPALPYPCSGPSAKASLPLSVAAPSQRSASQRTVALLAEVPFQAAKKSDRPDARACDRCANSVAGWPLPAARGQ
jgi:hypothetical protein